MRKFRKPTAIGAAALTAFLIGAGAAWAAVTITVTGGGAGGKGNVSSCDTTWTVALGAPTYSSSLAAYAISTVDYSNVSNVCTGKTLAVTVADSSNASLANGTVTLAGASGSITLSTPVTVDASAVIVSAIYG